LREFVRPRGAPSRCQPTRANEATECSRPADLNQRAVKVPVVPDVLFRPKVENLRNNRQRTWFGEPRMTDHGDHVEYFNGRQTHRWRLPDQPGVDPELTRVLVAGVQFPMSTKIANYTVGFYDRDGRLLSRVSHRPRLNFEQFDATLPDSTFTRLAQRGIGIERVRYRDGPHLHREHPEFTTRTGERRFLQHPLRWITAGMIVLVVAVNLILLADGYYS
jgi:hypothetical protein